MLEGPAEAFWQFRDVNLMNLLVIRERAKTLVFDISVKNMTTKLSNNSSIKGAVSHDIWHIFSIRILNSIGFLLYCFVEFCV